MYPGDNNMNFTHHIARLLIIYRHSAMRGRSHFPVKTTILPHCKDYGPPWDIVHFTVIQILRFTLNRQSTGWSTMRASVWEATSWWPFVVMRIPGNFGCSFIEHSDPCGEVIANDYSCWKNPDSPAFSICRQWVSPAIRYNQPVLYVFLIYSYISI